MTAICYVCDACSYPLPLGKLATESLSKTAKVTKTAHIFDFSLLYNSDFVNFVKNDNELNLSSVGFVTFDKTDI